MADHAREKFFSLLRSGVADGTLLKLTLGKPHDVEPGLKNIHIRPVKLRGSPHLSFVWRHATKDVTKNHPPAEALRQIEELAGKNFLSAHLFTSERTTQLEFDSSGRAHLSSGPAAPVAGGPAHDSAKQRLLPPESQDWLQPLGVTTAAGAVREGMADKHRQIHKFVEILSHRVADDAAHALPSDRPLEIADMGCGKGYLTFATHDYFNLVARRPANVLGVELRPALVETCNDLATRTQRPRLRFAAGTIEGFKPEALDVLIALHACDTATDDALARGIAVGAALMVVAPCCQKELRPQLRAAPVLAPALRHGIFQERHTEFVTDALRALLLEWAGYETRVFEFISTEHTAKNTMITALRRPGPARDESTARAARELAAFYGIESQSLARQLGFTF